MTNQIIQKEKEISAQLDKVWQVLTDPKYIQKWLEVEVESEWKEGSPILFKFTWEKKEYIDKGVILSLKENEVFSYSYWSVFSGLEDRKEHYSKITFELKNESGKTKLKLTHADFANSTMYEHSEKNWEHSLDMIKKIAESI